MLTQENWASGGTDMLNVLLLHRLLLGTIAALGVAHGISFSASYQLVARFANKNTIALGLGCVGRCRADTFSGGHAHLGIATISPEIDAQLEGAEQTRSIAGSLLLLCASAAVRWCWHRRSCCAWEPVRRRRTRGCCMAPAQVLPCSSQSVGIWHLASVC